MEDRLNLVAPCGLDCGICELYLSRDNRKLMDMLVSMGIPEEVLPCDGCKSNKGDCPVIKGKCDTYACSKEKGVSFCTYCDDFPCMRLAPVADRANTLPHNIKMYNLCLINKHGVEELIKKSLQVKQAYFKGKMVIGKGPEL